MDRIESLRGLFYACREPLDTDVLRVYTEGVSEYPDPVIERAADRLGKKSLWFPKLSELRQTCADITREARLEREARDYDPRLTYQCAACQDSGWLLQTCNGHGQCGRQTHAGEWVQDESAPHATRFGACQMPHAYMVRCRHHRPPAPVSTERAWVS